ncbi:MAG TPA: NADH-quinone oxidoreductase subunit NuoK [Candidatus Thermoplasmatota archaeon]|nr:NADH-quinone oxidoreductase subunit NuoK [Candidatus Thermoplasmatota archaeon]
MLEGFPPITGGWVVALSAALFAIGVYGMITQRSGIRLLMSIEIMLNAANLNFAAFSSMFQTSTGYAFALFSIALAAAEAAVGLAILVNLFRLMQNIDTERARSLRW